LADTALNLRQGANPTITSYNAFAVKIYKATDSQCVLKAKIFSYTYYEKRSGASSALVIFGENFVA
jgi:hypothetical protein